MSRTTFVPAAMAALAAVALVSGCGDNDSDGAAASTSAASATPGGAAAAVHNDADVTFAREMIPHHEQAVAMAAMVPSRSTDPRVLELAAQIQAAQDPEIATMTGWLRAWGTPASATTVPGDHGGMNHGGPSMPMSSGAMPGMMTDEQMTQMRAASGADFDRLWLTSMIAHHRGAVEMARTELAAGADPDAKALAQRIIDAQQAEITRMQALLQG
ncbi:DUF305 domain-containing protein [Nocardia arizonensis]|uniref:DUF305 domain-containing protein n=1 Tax=Nocardia arizonensis TaxID=1141647 RepID=UPI0006D083DF|nr:DUF305 domain-containing protein [Nocardia arizonensis]